MRPILPLTTTILSAAIVAGAALFPATPAAATTYSLGVTGGTLGVGPEVGARLTPLFGLRGNATFLSVNGHFTSNDLRYDGHVRLRSAGAMLDIYPFLGGFRLSAGARWNGNRARVVATPTGNANVGGQSFTPAQIGTLSGSADVRRFSPALTLGWGGHLLPGFTVGVEAGALFQGKARLSRFTSSTGLVPQARLDAERDSLQHDVDKLPVYPIAQLVLGFRF